jgi:hypothetical protein
MLLLTLSFVLVWFCLAWRTAVAYSLGLWCQAHPLLCCGLQFPASSQTGLQLVTWNTNRNVVVELLQICTTSCM